MSLINRLYEAGKRTSILGVALVGINGCQTSDYTPKANVDNIPKLSDSYKTVPGTSSPKPYSSDLEKALETFKVALGDRILPENELSLDAFFRKEVYTGKNAKLNAELFTAIYETPDKVKEKIKDKELKSKYKSFDPSSLSAEELAKIQKELPWRILPKDNKFTESDKLFIFLWKNLKDKSVPISANYLLW